MLIKNHNVGFKVKRYGLCLLLTIPVILCGPLLLFSQPVIEVEPMEVNFGVVGLDTTVSREVEITNSGDELLILELETADLDSPVFKVDYGIDDDFILTFFNFEITEEYHSVLILESYWDDEVLVKWMEVGIFTPGGLCVGARVVEEDGEQIGISAMADENGEPNGFREDEEMEFRFWDPATEFEVVAEPEFVHGSGRFRIDAVTIVILRAEGGSHRFPDGSIHLYENDSANLIVFFTPTEIEMYEADLVITSNDQENEEVTVELSGRGRGEGGPPEIRGPSEEAEFEIAAIEGEELHVAFDAVDPIDNRRDLEWTVSNQHDLPGENGDSWSFSGGEPGEAAFTWNIGFVDGRDDPYRPVFRVTDREDEYAEIMLIITVEDRPFPPPEPIPVQVIMEDAPRTVLFDLDDLFAEDDEREFEFSLILNPQRLGLRIEDRTNQVSATPLSDFWVGEPGLQALIIADCMVDTAYNLIFRVVVNSVNDPPGEFHLREPPNRSGINANTRMVHFDWEDSEQNEYELDEVSYQLVFLNMQQQGLDSLASPVLDRSEYEADIGAVLDSFQTNTQTPMYILWYVMAFDDSATVVASNGPFILIVIPIAVQEEDAAHLPDEFVLFPAFPNPFNNRTMVRFGVPASETVNLSLLNVRGESVKDLFTDKHFSAGFHEIELEMGEFPAGCYLMRLEYGGKALTQSIVLLK